MYFFKEYISFQNKYSKEIDELLKDYEDYLNPELDKFSNYMKKYYEKSKEEIKNSLLTFANLDHSIDKNKDYDEIKTKVTCDRMFDMNKIDQLKKMMLQISCNSEKIRNQFFKEEIEVHTVDNDDLVKEIQEAIYKENKHLEQYDGEKYKKIFDLVKDNYSIDFIENLVPKFDIYSCTYKKVKEYSKINPNNIFSILLYIFVKGINENFETLKNSSNSPDGAQVSYGNFIASELKKSLDYNRIMDFSEKELKKIDNREYYTFSKEIKKIDDNIKTQRIPPSLAKNIYGSAKFSAGIIEENVEHDADQIRIDKENRKEGIMSELKEKMAKETGKEPSLADLEDKYNEYMEDEYRDSEREQREMNMERPDEGLNVIDVGTDYGDMPQGIDQDENAIPDDLQKDDSLFMEY